MELPGFVIGMFVGQLVFFVVGAGMIYIIFLRGRKTSKQKSSHSVGNGSKLIYKTAIKKLGINEICQQVSYVPEPSAAESCGWLNVFLAQIIYTYRSTPQFSLNCIESLKHAFTNQNLPSFIANIQLSSFSLGTKFPVLNNAAVRSVDGELVTEISLTYEDKIELGIETEILLKFRGTLLASLPISLTVSLVNLKGTLMVQLKEEGDRQYLYFCFQKGLVLDFEVGSVLGEATKVQDLPKVTSMIVNKLRSWIETQILYPNKKKILLPYLLPKTKMKEEKTPISTPIKEPEPTLNPDELVSPRVSGLRRRKISMIGPLKNENLDENFENKIDDPPQNTTEDKLEGDGDDEKDSLEENEDRDKDSDDEEKNSNLELSKSILENGHGQRNGVSQENNGSTLFQHGDEQDLSEEQEQKQKQIPQESGFTKRSISPKNLPFAVTSTGLAYDYERDDFASNGFSFFGHLKEAKNYNPDNHIF